MSGALLDPSGKPLLIGNQVILGVPGGGGSGNGGGGGGGSGGNITPSGIGQVDVYIHGQSNAGFFEISDNAGAIFASSVAFWLGGLAGSGTYGATLSGGGAQSGTGVYGNVSGYADYLTWGGDTAAAAAAAAYASSGQGMISYIGTISTPGKAIARLILVDWGENDSLLTANSGGLAYTDKPVYKAALMNDLNQIRAAFGKTTAQLPIAVFGVSYGTFAGYAMVREAWAELAADPANNLVWAIQNTGDSTTRGNNWNATTGLETTGSPNGGHVDSSSNYIFAGRASLAAARIVQTSNGFSANEIPLNLGYGVGPKVTVAHLVGNTLTITVQHDGGNDLIVPLLAAQGVGWCLMDGGSITSPGNLILATACVRLSATQLQVTLASTPVHSAGSCFLFYPIQGAPTNSNQPLSLIGRGCAVTDNASTLMTADGITPSSAFGGTWNGNYALCSPMTITGSGSSSSATFGIVCI